MQKLQKVNELPRRSYRPQRRICPSCGSVLKRSHIVWRKVVLTLNGPVHVTSWGYRCPDASCAQAETVHRSSEAEGLHLKKRQFGRDVIVHIGYRRFWYHQTMYELHEWLSQDVGISVSERQVLNLIGDFLALLRAGQAAKVRTILSQRSGLIIGLDGMQPEKGNSCLYIVRELQSDLTLLAETLDDSSTRTLRKRIFQPLKRFAKEFNLSWRGVVSDAQPSIRLAVAQELPGTPHQACQSHCLRKAGEVTFNHDRNLKKRLKATFRKPLKSVERRIHRLGQDDPVRTVLADYADAMHSTLLEGGVAPFHLGGVRVFDDLTALADSLRRCQEKGGIRFSIA